MNIQTQLLYRLEQEKGTFLSGAALAQELQCSRNAIWKAIQNLKSEGYQITSVPNRGYRLLSENDILSPEAVLGYLDRKNVSITILPSVPSTSQKLKKLALDQMPPEGSFVLANAQTAGRGHVGHSFYSPADCGLYISVLLRPTSPVDIHDILSKASVAACRAVEKLFDISLKIRRSNDLYLNGMKVGGILTEAQSDMETGFVDFIIVGLGLNLLTPPEGYPPELNGIASSLTQASGEKLSINRSQLAAEFVNQLVKAHQDSSTAEEYLRRRDPEDPSLIK